MSAAAAPRPGGRDVLGILAGGGALPVVVAKAAERAGRPVHIVAIDGFAGAEIERFPHTRISLGQLDRLVGALRGAGARDLVIVGTLARPDLTKLRFDLGILRYAATARSLMRGGDDALLRRVVRFFESLGFTVRGVSEIAPELAAMAGPLGALHPDAAQLEALQRGRALIAALAPFDVAQAAVCDGARALAVEGADGTDAMLSRLASSERRPGAVLVKLPKPGQELRVDMPVIGLETVRRAAAAGLAGIAVAAGRTLVMDKAETIALADREGLFLVGIEAAGAAPARMKPHAADGRILGRHRPRAKDRIDIDTGLAVTAALAAAGAGRGAVVRRGYVLSVAAADEPAAEVVRRTRALKPWGGLLARRRGVLTADSVDEAAIAQTRAAGLAGIVATGPAAADLVAAADAHGLFILDQGARDAGT